MNKYGIVSTASITSRFIEGVRLAKDKIVCIGSRDLIKAKKFAEENDIEKYYGSYEEVYCDKDINVVYVPLINNLHYQCAKDALSHHKNVVLEKPFTIKTEEAKELFELARKNNCFLFEGVKNVFMPSTKFVKDNLYRIGKIISIETLQGTRKQFPQGHWMYDIKQGGGAYFGSASYVYHYLMHIFDTEITNLDGTYVPSFNSDLICNFSFMIRDIKVNSTIDLSKDLANTCTFVGEKGKIVVDSFWRSHHVEVFVDDIKIDEFNDAGNEFVYEARHIKTCLEQGLLQSPIINDEKSIKEVEYINYLYKKWKLI